MSFTVRFSPAVALRALCMVGALALVACSDEPVPGPDEDSDQDPTTETDKDAPTKKPDAGKTSTDKDASVSDPNQIRPKDAGKPPVKDPEPTVDAGTTPTAPRPDAGSTPTTPAGDGGTSVSGIAPAELEMLRQVCVDEINMYRATLSLPPVMRPTPQHESCSDQGAEKDGISKMAHSSAGAKNPCATAGMRGFPGFQSQNTCPGYPVGARGAATIAAALKGCLKQMWAEGEPPEGTEKCISDYFAGNTKCFLAHGHYINMKGTSKKVSCGFYDMGKSTFWMNQDFLN